MHSQLRRDGVDAGNALLPAAFGPIRQHRRCRLVGRKDCGTRIEATAALEQIEHDRLDPNALGRNLPGGLTDFGRGLVGGFGQIVAQILNPAGHGGHDRHRIVDLMGCALGHPAKGGQTLDFNQAHGLGPTQLAAIGAGQRLHQLLKIQAFGQVVGGTKLHAGHRRLYPGLPGQHEGLAGKAGLFQLRQHLHPA